MSQGGSISGGGGGSVTSVSGTANEIVSSGGADPIISLPADIITPGSLTTTTTLTATGLTSLNGGLVKKYTGTAISYTVLVTDQIIGVTSTASARTITMPAAGLTTGQVWTIKDESAACATNNITISGNGVNIIGSTSAATYVLSVNGGSVDIYYNGATFSII